MPNSLVSDAVVTLLTPRVAHLLGVGENLSERREAVERGIRDVYQFNLKETLESHYWAFAEELAVLRSNGTKPAYGYSYYCDLPANFVALTYMNFTGDINVGIVGAYQVFGKKMAVNQTPVYISYTRDIYDTDAFSPLFLKALAYSVAMELSLSLVGDKDLGDRLEKMRAAIKYESIGVDYRNQGTRERFENSDVLDSRFAPYGVSAGLDGAVDAEVPVTPIAAQVPDGG